MPENQFQNLRSLKDQSKQAGLPHEAQLQSVLNGFQHNQEVLGGFSGDQVNKSAATQVGALELLKKNDMALAKNAQEVVGSFVATEILKGADEEIDQIAPTGDPIKDVEASASRQEAVAKQADKRWKELQEIQSINSFLSSNQDDESADAKRKRLSELKAVTPKEQEFLARRDGMMKQLGEAKKGYFLDGDYPLEFGLTTDKNIFVGKANVVNVNGQYYVGLRPETDENGQPLSNEEKQNSGIVYSPINGNWNDLLNKKKDEQANLTKEMEELKAVSETPNPSGMNPGQFTAKEVLKEKQERFDKLNQEIEMITSPNGRVKALEMQAQEALMTDPKLRTYLPRGEHIGLKGMGRDLEQNGVGLDVVGRMLGQSKHVMNAVGGLDKSVITTVAGAHMLLGASDESMREWHQVIDALDRGVTIGGYGDWAHNDDFASKLAVELGPEVLQTALDVALGVGATVPLRLAARQVATRATAAFIARSGTAMTGIVEGAGARVGTRAAVKLEAMVGKPLTALISGVPGALEETGGLISRYDDAVKLHAEADQLDAMLKQSESVEGGSFMPPEERAKLEARRDEARREANIFEENVTSASYTTFGASLTLQSIGFDRIIKIGPQSKNMAEVFMRGVARKKLGSDATEGEIQEKADELFKTLTTERIAGLVDKMGGQKAVDKLLDASIEGFTETLETATSTGVTNYFFEENEDILGKDAIDAGGIGLVIGAITSEVTGRMNRDQQRRVLFDVVNKRALQAKRGHKVDQEVDKSLRDAALKGYGVVNGAEDVVKANDDGTFSIDDDQDIGTVDSPRGYFAGLNFKTREEALDFAETRWEAAFDVSMDRALAESTKSVDEDGNIIQNADTTAESSRIQAMKSMVKVAANAAAESGKTTSGAVYSSFLKSGRIGGNIPTGGLDQSRLTSTQQKAQDWAASVVAMAGSSDTIADPDVKAAIIAAAPSALQYLKSLDKHRKAEKAIDDDADEWEAKAFEKIDAKIEAERNIIISGKPVPSGGLTKEQTEQIYAKITARAQDLEKDLRGDDPRKKEEAKASLVRLFGDEEAAMAFDSNGDPIKDLAAIITNAAMRKTVDKSLEKRRGVLRDIATEMKGRRKLRRKAALIQPELSDGGLKSNNKARQVVLEATKKLKANRLAASKTAPKNKTAQTKVSSPTAASNPTPTSNVESFQEDPAMEESIKKKIADPTATLTPQEMKYQKEKEAFKPQAPEQFEQSDDYETNEEGVVLYQSDHPIEDRSEPTKQEFDYTLARQEEDPNGTKVRIYNYKAIEDLLHEAITSGRINGYNTPPNMRNPASLAMVFLRTQAYTNSQKSAGQAVTQRENFLAALREVYGDDNVLNDDGKSFGFVSMVGSAENGTYQEIWDDTEPLHRSVPASPVIFKELEKLAHRDGRKSHKFRMEEGEAALPLGYFGPIRFTQEVTENEETRTLSTYALVRNVYSHIDKDTGLKMRTYEMIPVSKAYAEARAVFDERAKRVATLENYLTAPKVRQSALFDKRSESKLTTREVIGMKITKITDEERDNEIKQIEDEMEAAALKLMQHPENPTDLATIESFIGRYDTASRAAKEKATQAAEAVSNARDQVNQANQALETLKQQQRELTTLGFAQPNPQGKSPYPKSKKNVAPAPVVNPGAENPTTPPEPYSAAPTIDPAAMQQAQDALAAAKEAQKEAETLHAEAEARSILLRAATPKVRHAQSIVNWFNSRKQMIKKLQSKSSMPTAKTENFLEKLAESTAVPATVREYAKGILDDLNDAGMTERAFRTIQVTNADGSVEDKIVETVGEYMHRMANNAVRGMSKMWMRSRVEDLLKMEVEVKGPEGPESTTDPVEEVTKEEQGRRAAASSVFLNYDPAKHEYNTVIDTILLEPDDIADTHVHIPTGKVDRDGPRIIDLVRGGMIGFARPVSNAQGRLDFNEIAKAARNEALRRGKSESVANNLRVIRLSDGRWARLTSYQGEMRWFLIDKDRMMRATTQHATGLIWNRNSRTAKVNAAMIIESLRPDSKQPHDPTAITEVVEKYSGKMPATSVYIAPIKRLVDKLGPKAESSAAAALHRAVSIIGSLGQGGKSRGEIERSERQGLGGVLRKHPTTQRQGVPQPGLEELPFDEQLDNASKYNDDIDGALGETERSLSAFMEGGGFLQSTEAPEKVYQRIIDGVKTTYPGSSDDELIDAYLDGIVMDSMHEQREAFNRANLSREEQESLYDDLATINKADEDEMPEVQADVDGLIDPDGDDETPIDESMFGANGGMNIGTDANDYNKLVELLKHKGLIPQDVQNLGEFTLEQWLTAESYSVSEVDVSDYEDWSNSVDRDGYLEQTSSWGRRRLLAFRPKVFKGAESFDYSIMNPKSPLRKAAKVGDIVKVGNEDMEVTQVGEELKLGKPANRFQQVQSIYDTIKKEAEAIEKEEKKNKVVADKKPVAGLRKDMPSIWDIEMMVNELLETSPQTVVRIAESRRLRSELKREVAKLRQKYSVMSGIEYASNKRQAIIDGDLDEDTEETLAKINSGIKELVKVEFANRVKPVMDRLESVDEKLGQEVGTSSQRKRLQKKITGSLWYKGRVKGAMLDMDRVVWSYKGDSREPAPLLSETYQRIAENLGVSHHVSSREILDSMVGHTPEQDKAIHNARAFFGAAVGYLHQYAASEIKKQTKEGETPAANPFDTLAEEFDSEIGVATEEANKHFITADLHNHFSWRYLMNFYNGYPLSAGVGNQRGMALVSARMIIEAISIAKKSKLGGGFAYAMRKQIGSIWMTGKFEGGNSKNPAQFASMGDRLSQAMMPNGWTRPYMSKGIDTSDARDVGGQDYEGKMQRPPKVEQSTSGEFVETEERYEGTQQGSSPENARPLDARPFYGVYKSIKVPVTPKTSTRKLSRKAQWKKDKATKKNKALYEAAAARQKEWDESGNALVRESSFRAMKERLAKENLFGISEAKDVPGKQHGPTRWKVRTVTAQGSEGPYIWSEKPIRSVAAVLNDLVVTDGVFGADPIGLETAISGDSNETVKEFLQNLIETNRQARENYYKAQGEIRFTVANDDRAIPEQSAEKEALLELALDGWKPYNNRRANEQTGQEATGSKLNPEMTGDSETFYQGGSRGWRGRVSVGGDLPHALLELNPERATADTFGHEVTHWLNNTFLADGTSLMEAAMGPDGYADLRNLATDEGRDDPNNYPAGSVDRKLANVRMEERMADSVMAYFARGSQALVGADRGILILANIVKRCWKQKRKQWEVDIQNNLINTEAGKKAIQALDNVFVHSTGASQLKKINRDIADEEEVIAAMMRRNPKMSKVDAARAVQMVPDAARQTLVGLNAPIIPSTNQGLSPTDPVTMLHQYDHIPNAQIAKNKAEGSNWVARQYRKASAASKTRKLWQKALEFFASTYQYGMVTAEIFQAKLTARHWRAKTESTLAQVTDDIRMAIDRAVNVVNSKQKTADINKAMNSYLSAPSLSDRFQAKVELGRLGGSRLVIAAWNARNLIDTLSVQLITDGVVHGPMKATITANLGTYLHRTFPYAKNTDLVGRIGNPEMAATLNSVLSEMIRSGYAENTNEAHDVLVKVLHKIKSEAVNYTKDDKFGVSSSLQNRSVPQDLADIIAPFTGMETNPLINFTKTVMELTSLHSKHIFQSELRDVGLKTGYIGLPKDPRFTIPFGNTDKAPLDSNQAAEENWQDAHALGPLQGFVTSPEIAEFYDHVVKTEFDVKSEQGLWVSLVKINGVMKVMQTVHNWRTGIKNIYGAYLTYLGTGHSTKGLMKAWETAIGVEFANVGTPNQQRQARIDRAREVYNELVELGIADGGMLGDFLAIANNATGFASLFTGGQAGALADSTNTENGISRKVRRAAEKYRRARARFYMQGDVFFKMGAYFADLENLRGVYPNMPGKELKQLAAKRTSLSMFSFDLEPRLIKNLKTVPLMGNFISFQAGMLRARLSGYFIALNDIKDGNRMIANGDANGKKLKWMGVRRGAGLMATQLIAAKAFGTLARSLFGWWDEPEKMQALRDVVNPWDQEGQLIPLDNFKAGGEPFQYFNLSTVLPDAWHVSAFEGLGGVLVEGIDKISRGEDNPAFYEKLYSKVLKTIENTAGPFVDQTALTQAITSVFGNQNQYGKEIVGGHDEGLTKLGKMSLHIARMFIPGDVKGMASLGALPQDTAALVLGKSPEKLSGFEVLTSALGMRVSTVNPEKNIQYVYARDLGLIYGAIGDLTNTLGDVNITVDEGKAYAQLEKTLASVARGISNLSERTESWLTLGVPPPMIAQGLADAKYGANQRLSRDMKEDVIIGEFRNYITISKQTYIRWVEAAREAEDPNRMKIANDMIQSGRIRVESGR